MADVYIRYMKPTPGHRKRKLVLFLDVRALARMGNERAAQSVQAALLMALRASGFKAEAVEEDQLTIKVYAP